MTTKAAETTTTPDDDFSAAFASFAEPEKKAADTTAGSGTDGQGSADAGTAGAGDSVTADTVGSDAGDQTDTAGPEDTTSSEGETETVEAADTETATAEASSAGSGDEVEEAAAAADSRDGEAEAILAKLSKLVKEAPVEEKPAATVETESEAEVELYTPEEKETIAAYEKDWADVARGEALKRKAEYHALLQHTFREVWKEFQPIKELAEQLAERTHFSDIKAAVPDYSDSLRDQVVNWVGKQPKYLQDAYNQVIQQGTVDEVNDLIARYKKEAGVRAPTKTSTKEVELSGEAKQAAAALAPVNSKRTVIEQQDDPSNFDAAFAKFSSVKDD